MPSVSRAGACAVVRVRQLRRWPFAGNQWALGMAPEHTAGDGMLFQTACRAPRVMSCHYSRSTTCNAVRESRGPSCTAGQ